MFYCFFSLANIAHSIFMHFHDVEIIIQKALPESETSHNHFSFAIFAPIFAPYLDVSADLRCDPAIFSTFSGFVPLCLPELINVMFARHVRFFS